MLPSATDRKNVDNRVGIFFPPIFFFPYFFKIILLECPKYKHKIIIFGE